MIVTIYNTSVYRTTTYRLFLYDLSRRNPKLHMYICFSLNKLLNVTTYIFVSKFLLGSFVVQKAHLCLIATVKIPVRFLTDRKNRLSIRRVYLCFMYLNYSVTVALIWMILLRCVQEDSVVVLCNFC